MQYGDSDTWVTAALASLSHALVDVAGIGLGAVSDDELTAYVDGLTAVLSGATAQLARGLVEAERRGLDNLTGARNAPVWWAHRSRVTRAEAGHMYALARRLDDPRNATVQQALADGDLRADQADVITRALDALPADLVDAQTRARARDVLLAEATEHDARALRILGKRVLDVVAPELGEAREQRALEREEAHAAATATFRMVDDGYGRCHGRFTLPSLHGRMLSEHLHTLASPARHRDEQTDHGEWTAGPVVTPHSLGTALMEYVESYPVDRLPAGAASGLSLTLTMPLTGLVAGMGAASLSTGERVSAGEVRRLACRAGLVPAVLGTASEPLDLGRTTRLFTPAQRRALVVRDRGCTADGCGMPPGACHAHHDLPWSAGQGPTDLANGRLLCPRHHRLAHDRRYQVQLSADNRVAFHRRT